MPQRARLCGAPARRLSGDGGEEPWVGGDEGRDPTAQRGCAVLVVGHPGQLDLGREFDELVDVGHAVEVARDPRDLSGGILHRRAGGGELCRVRAESSAGGGQERLDLIAVRAEGTQRPRRGAQALGVDGDDTAAADIELSRGAHDPLADSRATRMPSRRTASSSAASATTSRSARRAHTPSSSAMPAR